MKLKRNFNPLRIGKGLLCLFALFMMLLSPQRAWAAVFTTSTLTEASEGDAKYTWAVAGLGTFDVKPYYDSDGVNMSSNPVGITVGGYGCTIRGLKGATAISDYNYIIYKVKINGVSDNNGISVALDKSYGNDVAFIASTEPGEFYVPNSVIWDTNEELLIEVRQECTITGIEVYRSIVSNGISYGWSSSPIDNGTIQGAKQSDGSITINAFEHQSYSYQFTNEGATYNSTNTSVATVGTDGAVTIKKTGSTTITATILNSNSEVSENITLGYTLTVDFPAPTIIPNGGHQLSATEIALSYEATNMPDLKYKWGDGEEKSYSAPFAVQTGTLTAWAEIVPSGSQTAIKSYEATATFTAVPGTSYGLTVGGVPVTSDNCGNVLGDNEDVHKVTYDASTKTLTLNNVTMTGNVVRTNSDNLTVNFVGTSRFRMVEANHDYAFVGNGGVLTLTTTGSVVNPLLVDNTWRSTIMNGWNAENSTEVASSNTGSPEWWVNTSTGTSDQIALMKKPLSYNLTVASVEVTSENASDITGDGIQGTVSFTPAGDEPAMLTLNNATINLTQMEGPGIRYTGSTALIIKLIGTNSIHTQYNCEPILCDIENSTKPALTFEKGSQPCSLELQTSGSTTVIKGFSAVNGVNGIADATGNSLALSNAPVSYNASTGLYTGENTVVTSATITSGYGLTVAGVLVHEGNKDNVLGDQEDTHKVTFTPAVAAEGDNPAIPATLTLNGATISGDIETSLDNLTISVSDANTLTGSIKYTGTNSSTATLTLDANLEYANSASLALSTTSQEIGVISGYQSGKITINSPLETDITEWTTDVKSATIAAERYDIIVAGVLVTNANKANVLETPEGTPTVSFTPASGDTPAMLTLNGATIGGGSEPAEACGIDYLGTADLTISLKGTNTITGTGGCEAIRYNNAQANSKLIFTKGDNNECSLQLSTGEEGRTAISGFSAVEGVWGIGNTGDNGLAIIADNQVKYSQTDGLQKEKVVNSIVGYVALSSVQIASYYGLTISGVPVYEGNKENIAGSGISGSGSASFNSTTNTLTLNNINLNPDYGQNENVSVSIVTSLAQLNINLIGESQSYAIKAANENSAVTFNSAAENRGAARLNFWNNTNSIYFIGFGENKVIYNDGLCLRENWYNSSFSNIVALDVPNVVTEEKECGLYYPDHEFTFSLEREIDGFDIYYANMLGGDPVKTTDGKFTLATGNYVLRVYPIYSGMDTDPSRNYQFASEISAKVIAKPTFTVEAGTYNVKQTIYLENIPEQNTKSLWDDELQQNVGYPQIWYFKGENKDDSIRYDSQVGIEVTESCKVSVYILDEDSNKVIKSQPVEAQYVIRQDAGLAFVQGEEPVEVAEYTIGGTENQPLPTLQNENEQAITYNSSNPAVATVNNDGEVTIVGMGETTISATSAETETLLAGYAAYPLTVYKDLSYESISVTVNDAIYTGEPVTPEVTVMDGETNIADYVTIAYSDNTDRGTGTVTITPNNDLEVNYYVGTASANFSIDYRTLALGAEGDVQFANGQNWATYYTTTEDLLLPEGIAAYVVTGVDGSTVTTQRISKVMCEIPVLLQKYTTAPEAEINDDFDYFSPWKGTTEATTIDDLLEYYVTGAVYVLYNNAFVKATSGTIPAKRGVLVIGEEMAAPRLTIDIVGGTTGVSDARSKKADVSGNFYDLTGRKVQKPSKKGLYINEGHKVVVK